jgi:tetratricopeptide (TPR) repeat protein
MLAAFATLVKASPLMSASADPLVESREARRRAYWHFANAIYAQNMGDTDRALVEFQQSSRYDPASAAVHAQLAYHYYVSGLDYKTVEELQKSLDINPQDHSTRLLLAGLFAKQGEAAKAKREYQRILSEDPKNTDARYYLAGVYVSENHNEEAVQQYRDILKVGPKDSWAYYAWYNLGLLYTRMNEAGKAEGAFKSAIALNPALESAYLSLGLLFEWGGRPQEAVETYVKMLQVEPGNPQAEMALGKVLYDGKDYANAFQAF